MVSGADGNCNGVSAGVVGNNSGVSCSSSSSSAGTDVGRTAVPMVWQRRAVSLVLFLSIPKPYVLPSPWFFVNYSGSVSDFLI